MFAIIRGLLIGIAIGAGTSLLAIRGLHLSPDVPLDAAMAYILAVGAGLLVGLLAGKPIWAKGARIEAGLKAFFGALLGAGLMFALRKWLRFDLDVSSLGLGRGPLGTNPALAYSMVSVALALLFEVDNLFGEGESKPERHRVLTEESSSRTDPEEETSEQESDDGSKSARSNRR